MKKTASIVLYIVATFYLYVGQLIPFILLFTFLFKDKQKIFISLTIESIVFIICYLRYKIHIKLLKEINK